MTVLSYVLALLPHKDFTLEDRQIRTFLLMTDKQFVPYIFGQLRMKTAH